MSEQKFTPGPWRVSPRDVAFYQRPDGDALVDGADEKIRDWPSDAFLQFEIEGPAVVWGRGDFNGPDALLVAAAPDLYAALEELVERAEREICDPIDVPQIQYAKDVLKKARGEQ